MKKRIMTLLLVLGLGLCGCGGKGDSAVGTGSGSINGNAEKETVSEQDSQGEKDGIGTEILGEEGGAAAGMIGSKGAAVADEESGTVSRAAGFNRTVENETGQEDSQDRGEGEGSSAGGGAGYGDSEAPEGTKVVQDGPYGEISVMLPAGWKYELCPMDSDKLLCTDYGIHFSPEDAEAGYIELAYTGFFGVCGTGLALEDAVLAGTPVSIGTYDNHAYWDYINFKEENDGVVALTYWVENWWEEYKDTVIEILDTLSFDPAVKTGGACIFKEESENREIGLYFSLKDISSKGATLVYNQFDAEAPSGQLEDGDDFILEQCIDGQWEAVPVILAGDYGFHDVAYTIPNEEVIERKLDWEWLHGELPPGEYRIGKNIIDFRKTADYDMYKIYAYFVLN